jgi:hypothetical protein
MAPPDSAADPRPASASPFENADLAARVTELLRRDAERHGIDLTGLEP